MELSDAHKAQVSRYFAFFKGRRDRSLMDREHEKEDFKNDRLSDDGHVFNNYDAISLIEQYHAQIVAPLREELHATSNLSAVYLSQLMAQADQQGLVLEADILSVEDQNKMNAIAMLENSGMVPLPRTATRGGLAPVAPAGYNNDPTVLQQLSDAQDDSRQMRDRYQQMQTEVSELLKERSTLSEELEKVKTNFKQMRSRMQETNTEATSAGNIAEIERSLDDTKVMLDSKQAECDRMRNDMDKRLGDSKQFTDLKALLKKKADENKALKRRMQEYGIPPMEGQEGCVELQADSD